MATATAEFTTTTKEVVEEVVVKEGITLELSFEEAVTLRGLLHEIYVDGPAADSAYQHVNAIREALGLANIACCFAPQEVVGKVTFRSGGGSRERVDRLAAEQRA